MKTAIMTRTVRFKFGESLKKGSPVLIVQNNVDQSTYMVRHAKHKTLEFIVAKDAVKLTNGFWHVVVTKNCIKVVKRSTPECSQVKNSRCSFTTREGAVMQANQTTLI